MINEKSSLIEDLKALRDDLKVRVHLFSMEAKDQWIEIEEKYEDVNQKMSHALDTASDIKADLWHTHKGVLNEIKQGYQRIKKDLE